MKVASIREYRPGDERKIIELFNTVFQIDKSMERWRWQFAEQCQGKSWITLAESDEEIVGQFSVVHQHLNSAGREILAGQAVDGMVHPDHRGTGCYGKLVKTSLETVSRLGVEAMFGFPNRATFPGYIRSSGWERIATLKEFSLRLGYCRVWRRPIDVLFKSFVYLYRGLRGLLLKKQLGNVSVDIVSSLPPSVEGLMKEIQDQEVLSVWKDLAYLKWRYERHPEHSYRFHLLTADDTLTGLVVTKEVGPRALICEFLHRTKEVKEAAFLLNAVVRHFARGPSQQIVFFGHDEGFFETVFLRCGFKKTSARGFIFAGRVFSATPLKQRFYSAQNWTLVYGDTDVA